jgi:hypothetical protein
VDEPLEVRCFCARKPLLAVCGRDARTGQGFVHLKTWKGQRLYAEVVVSSGTAHIRCRDCFRWHRVRIVNTEVEIQAKKLPESIAI